MNVSIDETKEGEELGKYWAHTSLFMSQATHASLHEHARVPNMMLVLSWNPEILKGSQIAHQIHHYDVNVV